MNISGIRPSIGFYDYNSIKIRPEASVDSLAMDEQAPSLAVPSSDVSTVSDDDIAAARSKQTFGTYDFASQYKPGESFELKGVDSDINSLDVERAVSDMQKDSAIQQYQYFVNPATQAAETASVRGAEDFSL